jgi:hypothetical protein
MRVRHGSGLVSPLASPLMKSHTSRTFLECALCAGLAATLGCSATSGDGNGAGPGSDAAVGPDASMSATPEGGAPGDHTASQSPTVDATAGEAASGGVDARAQDVGLASPPDAASVDAPGSPDGGIGGAAAAVHDDFESGDLAKWSVTDPFGNPQQSMPTVTVDTTMPAHSGTHSVKVHNGGLIGTTPPAPNFYGRFWVWLGSNPSPGRGSGGHWGWVVGAGPLPGGTMAEVRQGGQFDILIDNYSVNDDIVLSDPNLFNDTEGGVPPPVGKWVCVEFFYGKDSLRTWLGGTEITALDVTPATVWAHGMKAPWSPTYSAIRIGYAGYNGNAIDLWVDDVAIDANRIGCN